MTKRPIARLLALSAGLLLPGTLRAQASAARNPCADAAKLTTGDAILGAVPAGDKNWADMLYSHWIAKDDTLGWRLRQPGFERPAHDGDFVLAFADYCAARNKAAGVKPAAAKSNLPDWAVAANKEAEKNWGKTIDAQMAADGRANARMRAAAASMSSSGMPEAPEAPASDASLSPEACASYRAQADGCDAAGMPAASSGRLDAVSSCNNARLWAAKCLSR